MFEHRIEDEQQFPHAGRQGDIFGFPGRTQAVIGKRKVPGTILVVIVGIDAFSKCGDEAGEVCKAIATEVAH